MSDGNAPVWPTTEARDPLARLLVGKLKFTPLTFAVSILLADGVVDGWMGWHYQVFTTTGATPGILQDASALLTDFVVKPIVCGTYLWSNRWSADLFRRLSEVHVFEKDDVLRSLEARRQGLYRKRRIFALILSLALLATFAQVATYKSWMPWRTIEGYLYLHHGDMSFFRAPFWLIAIYSVMYTIYHTAVNVYLIDCLFRKEPLRVQLLHPDGCGGLGSLAEFALAGVMLIVPMGALASASIIAATVHGTLAVAYPVWIMLAAYLILAPLLLLLPVYAAHQAMVRSKQARLKALTDAYNQAYCEAAKTLADRTTATDARNRFARLAQIKLLYDTTKSDHPTWPLNVNTIQRYTTAVLSPLVPAVISVVIDLGLKVLQSSSP